MIKTFAGIVGMILVSCSSGVQKQGIGSSEASYSDQDSIQSVSVIQKFPKKLASVQDEFKAIDLPLSIQGGDIEKNISEHILTLSQLEFLSGNVVTTDPSDDFYILESKRIYRLKESGKYKRYVEQLDLANLKDATAHPYGMIDLDSVKILLWGIQYNSYEACPFYSGIDLFASTVFKDSISYTYPIGSESTGGDPPAMSETFTKVYISENLKVHRNIISKTYEDDELIETNSKNLQFTFNW